MKIRKMISNFWFRYIITICTIIIIYYTLDGTEYFRHNTILFILLILIIGIFPVLVLGWPAFHFGNISYKRRPVKLRLYSGLLIVMLPIPIQLLVGLIGPSIEASLLEGLSLSVFLLWQLGKWTAGIREFRNKNERIPSHLIVISVFLGFDILFYVGTIVLTWFFLAAWGF